MNGPCLALLAAIPVQAEDGAPQERYTLRVEYREWRPTLTSEVQFGTDLVPGTVLDLKQDLGIEDERTFEAHGRLQIAPGHKLRFSVTPISYAGDTVARRSFAFNGRTYTVSTRVVSSLEGKLYTAGYEWDLVRRPQGYFGIFIGGQLFDGDASLAAPALGFDEQRSNNTPVPVLGAAARVYSGRLGLEGEFSGLTIGDRGHAYELAASARLYLSDRLALQGGYRLLKLQGEEQPDFLRVRLGGFTFGVELSL
jgi:hypothetical protein